MAMVVFSGILVLSVLIALMAKKGAIGSSMDDVMTASGSFGAFLIFFISIGEIYSIGTMIGAPGAIYSSGASYGVWFITYILLAYTVGYFLNPAIWRMGQLAKAVSIGDVIGWRYNSKGMQVLVALVGIGFLTPWIQNQYAGMAILFEYLNIGVSFFAAVLISSVLAFVYIAVAGIRAPAWVSVLKDFLLIVSIVTVGVGAAVVMDGGVGGIFREVAATKPEMLTVPTDDPTKPAYMFSTIVFQMLGFYMLPISFQALLTSQNAHNLRRNSIFMPMYMIMFPFLVVAAYYAVAVVPELANKDYALLAVAVSIFPDWVIGMIAGGGALTAILVMAISALCVRGLFSKNILGVIRPQTSQKSMTNWTRVVTAVFLIFGMLTALYFPALMASVITLAYGGLSQTFVSVFLGFFWKGATKWGVGAGLIAGVATLASIINLMDAPPLGVNPGFWALTVNFVVAIVVSSMTKPDEAAAKRFEAFQMAKPNRQH